MSLTDLWKAWWLHSAISLVDHGLRLGRPLDYGSMSDSLGASSDAASLDGASLHEGQVDGDDRGRAEGSQAPDGGSIQSVGTGRRRGSRGGASWASGATSGRGRQGGEKKWRSGAVPPAPVFEGDIEQDPFLPHYRKRLMRWVLITAEFLPKNEQALRAREQLKVRLNLS